MWAMIWSKFIEKIWAEKWGCCGIVEASIQIKCGTEMPRKTKKCEVM